MLTDDYLQQKRKMLVFEKKVIVQTNRFTD